MTDRSTSNSLYAIRIVRHDGYEESIKKLLDTEQFETALCLKHKGSRDESVEHYHLCIKMAKPIKEPTLRARLNLIFTQGKGNGHMSMKLWDGKDEALSYMFHEPDAPIIVNKGYSEERLEELRQINSKYKSNFDQKQAGSAFGLCLKQLNEGTLKYDEIAISLVYCQMMLDNGKMLPDPFALRRAVNTIMSKHDERGKHFMQLYVQDVWKPKNSF